MRRFSAYMFGAALMAAPLCASSAFAQSASAPKGQSIVTEIKGGVVAHDVPFLGSHKEDGVSINAEILFQPPGLLKPLWAPRPMIGAQVNTAGNTSYGYAGLAWSFHMARDAFQQGDAFFADVSVGGAVHTGETKSTRRDEKSLGFRALFREAIDLGYRTPSGYGVSLYLDHISNARLANENEGITNLGVRGSYRF